MAEERRKIPRLEFPTRMAVNFLAPHVSMSHQGINISRDGLCLRVRELLEVRSLVRFRLTADPASLPRSSRPIECTGRVAWVTQRLDLTSGPPFFYDVGVEFVDPPPALRQLLARRGEVAVRASGPAAPSKPLEAAVIRGRRYVPRLDRDGSGASAWHLIVTVEGMPCFSARYATDREAMTAWLRFKRRQARR